MVVGAVEKIQHLILFGLLLNSGKEQWAANFVCSALMLLCWSRL